jgi:hypothetical protein
VCVYIGGGGGVAESYNKCGAWVEAVVGGGAEARLRAEANTAVVSWVESGGGGETKCPL